MKLHRFFTETEIPQQGEFSIVDEGLLNQWRNVLRMKAGDEVILFDGGSYEFLCEFVSLDKKGATLKVVERKQGLKPAREVTLCMALIKKDNFEFVLEKATELGVTNIVPVVADRSEKKGVNYERAQKIVREASEQSGRVTVPTLGEICTIDQLSRDGLVVLDPRGELSARKFFASNTTTPISVLIGPEGGFTEAEIEMFHTRNIPIVATGTQVLRAETAAIAALAMVLLV